MKPELSEGRSRVGDTITNIGLLLAGGGWLVALDKKEIPIFRVTSG